jgi:hypothetical protein
MTEVSSRRRFRISIRALMIAVALCALFFTPIVWMYRRTEAMLNAERRAAEAARAAAKANRAQVRAANALLNGANANSESNEQP